MQGVVATRDGARVFDSKSGYDIRSGEAKGIVGRRGEGKGWWEGLSARGGGKEGWVQGVVDRSGECKGW